MRSLVFNLITTMVVVTSCSGYAQQGVITPPMLPQASNYFSGSELFIIWQNNGMKKISWSALQNPLNSWLNTTRVIEGQWTFTSVINANINGNASTVTNGVYTTGAYSNPSWIASLAGNKITGTIPNVVYSNQSYENPSWIANLNASKITGTLSNAALPSTISFKTLSSVVYSGQHNFISGSVYFDTASVFTLPINRWSKQQRALGVTADGSKLVYTNASNQQRNIASEDWVKGGGYSVSGKVDFNSIEVLSGTFLGSQTFVGVTSIANARAENVTLTANVINSCGSGVLNSTRSLTLITGDAPCEITDINTGGAKNIGDVRIISVRYNAQNYGVRIKHGSGIVLQGNKDFVMYDGDTIVLFYNGVAWQEFSRLDF